MECAQPTPSSREPSTRTSSSRALPQVLGRSTATPSRATTMSEASRRTLTLSSLSPSGTSSRTRSARASQPHAYHILPSRIHVFCARRFSPDVARWPFRALTCFVMSPRGLKPPHPTDCHLVSHPPLFPRLALLDFVVYGAGGKYRLLRQIPSPQNGFKIRLPCHSFHALIFCLPSSPTL